MKRMAIVIVATLPHLMLAAGPAPIDLKSCSNFAILAGSTITCTGAGTVNGDVGLSPAGSVVLGTPPAQINGTVYNDDGNPIGAQAQDDLTVAYDDATSRSADRITMPGDIGGTTNAPGLYWSASSLLITGDLTLTGGPDDVWIFQMGSTLTTAAGGVGAPASRVILTGGALAKNVFWQVGSSATLGTYSVFKGTIMAQASITMDTGSIVEGRALARTAKVEFNGAGASLPYIETLVTMGRFEAFDEGGQVVVEWETVSEIGTAGFYLYRTATDPKTRRGKGKSVQVNEQLLPAAIEAPQGGVYRLMDPGAELGKVYLYEIVEAERTGALNRHGPFLVVPQPRKGAASPKLAGGFSGEARVSEFRQARIARQQELERKQQAAESNANGSRIVER